MTSIENVELGSVISEWNDYSEKRKRWKELGFLEGLSNHREQVVVENYEEAVEWFKTHHYSDSEGNWEVVIFPIARIIGEKGMFGAEKLDIKQFFDMIGNKTIKEAIDTLFPFIEGNEDKTLMEMLPIVNDEEYNHVKRIDCESTLSNLISELYLILKERELRKEEE